MVLVYKKFEFVDRLQRLSINNKSSLKKGKYNMYLLKRVFISAFIILGLAFITNPAEAQEDSQATLSESSR